MVLCKTMCAYRYVPKRMEGECKRARSMSFCVRDKEGQTKQ